ncbi:MAG: hypothetical protein BGO10_06660 [Chlamydia sp. 32-24]|nr:MAG: hypothetical protein BGO10_06660 [Chlamydia sp. 32-24]
MLLLTSGNKLLLNTFVIVLHLKNYSIIFTMLEKANESRKFNFDCIASFYINVQFSRKNDIFLIHL